jgi:hypothetical protein
MHQNALCDPQIPLNAKTQVQHKVSRRTFCHIRTSRTRALKMVRQRFVPWIHWIALRDLQIPSDVKTQVWRNVPRQAFYHIRTSQTRA